MQESEIVPSFEDGAEWVEKPDEASALAPPAEEPVAEQKAPEVSVAPVGVRLYTLLFYLLHFLTWL
jgi:hypothetical protein